MTDTCTDPIGEMKDDPVSRLFFSHFRISSGDPDRDMLRSVITHFAEIPYENLTKIITKFTIEEPDERLRDPEEVLRGFIENHTGGTCFSLTWCLGAILSGAGFRCYPVMADMKRANVHCALVVHIGDRRFFVDPGYLLGEPVQLTALPVSVETSFGKVELRPGGTSSYDLFTVAGTEKKWRYRVRTTPVPVPLFIRYWKESFSLPMMNSLQLTRLTGNGHLYIKNHHLRLRKGDRKLNENIRAGLHARIESEFGIPPEITTQAQEYIERMKEGWRIRKREGHRKGLR
ncbi:MAG TPA: arylamine N-acetyltransferase [Candidatus Krumholzibacterium sp.]|nr:arylamine N-acetyltransferase [Candidatus Krumholzibacterium sp.]